MEHSKKFYNQLSDFTKALKSFEKYLAKDFSKMNADDLDANENAMIQKFEVCCELTWKTIKLFLEERGTLEFQSPLDVLKGFFQKGYADAEIVEGLIAMIKDRNKMSHIYSEDFFRGVIGNLSKHFNAIQKAKSILDRESK